MKNKPMFLADIDGVFNAFRAYDKKGYRHAEVDGFPLTYRPEWIGWMNTLAEASDPIWATMWQDRAATAFAPATGIGTTIERYIDFDEHRQSDCVGRIGNGVGHYKHPGVIATVGKRPFVWIDDDLTPRLHAWARTRTKSGIPTLLIQPDPAVGITGPHVATAHQFLRAAATLVA